MNIKPQLANDAVLDDITYPAWVQPKIDGVRGMNLAGTFTGRSLDPFEGKGITEYFSKSIFKGFDGEMILGDDPKSQNRLCAMTTGAMSRFKDVDTMADLHWWLFDYLTENTIKLPYSERYSALVGFVDSLFSHHPRLHLVPTFIAKNRFELDFYIHKFATEGYEGTIIRNPEALYKPGRPTKKHRELWRVKPWSDAEILVTGITEGESNTNEAKTNSLGRTERSSAMNGMVPNGRLGSIQGTLLADFHDPITGQLLFPKGLELTVSKGSMTEDETLHYFSKPEEIVGHIVKFRHMTHGVKNYPRFPTYLSHRLLQDL